jgi:xanthine dehydrogenase accessory factor
MVRELPPWPLFGLADDVRPALARARTRGEAAALATIIALDGGGPRPVGTQMSVAPSELCGFLSGGCLEADVAAHAQDALADGAPRRLVYGEGSPWPDIRLLCGARIEVLLEPLAPDDAAVGALLALGERRVPALWLSDGTRRACAPQQAPPASWPGAFARVHLPRLRLIVLGSDPTALAIASLGAQCGFETTLVRPKGPPEPPPLTGVAYRREGAAQALAAIGLDRWTAVAVASHEAALDHEALATALPSPAFYVGALGARRRLGERRAMLSAAGLTPTQIDRLHAPIGLNIGGKAPFEVAVSVVAQITALRHGESYSSRSSASASTRSPVAAVGARAGRRNRAWASANTLTSDES